MVHQQLVTYIRAAREGGYSLEEIRPNLLAAGWAKEDADEALAVVQKMEDSLGPARRTSLDQLQTTDVQQQPDASAQQPAPEQRQAGQQPPSQPEPRKQAFWHAWFSCITDSEATLKAEKYRASFGRTVSNYFASALVAISLWLLLSVMELRMFVPAAEAVFNALAAYLTPDLVIVTAPLLLLFLLTTAFYVLNSSVVGATAYYLVARLAGLKPNFSELAHLLSIVFAPVLLVYVAVTAFLNAGYLIGGGAGLAAMGVAGAMPFIAGVLILSSSNVSRVKAAAIVLAMALFIGLFTVGAVYTYGKMTGAVNDGAAPLDSLANSPEAMAALAAFLFTISFALAATLTAVREACGVNNRTAAVVVVLTIIVFLGLFVIFLSVFYNSLQKLASSLSGLAPQLGGVRQMAGL